MRDIIFLSWQLWFRYWLSINDNHPFKIVFKTELTISGIKSKLIDHKRATKHPKARLNEELHPSPVPLFTGRTAGIHPGQTIAPGRTHTPFIHSFASTSSSCTFFGLWGGGRPPRKTYVCMYHACKNLSFLSQDLCSWTIVFHLCLQPQTLDRTSHTFEPAAIQTIH